MALTDPAAMEKAADDFAAKFPDSELRPLLYKATMQRYQQANNADKMLEMAQEGPGDDPDDPEALVGVAQVIAERTRDTDLDKTRSWRKRRRTRSGRWSRLTPTFRRRAIHRSKLAAYKGYLRSEIYAVLGTLASNAKNWAEAESNLRKSIDAFPQQLDSIAVLRLAVALDMQNKIPEALKYANQAVDLTKDHPDSAAGKAARAEQDRLTKLDGGTAPGQTAAPPKN